MLSVTRFVAMGFVVAAIVLAGCAARPTIPDDAVSDTDERLPGLKLTAWIEEKPDRLRFSAMWENGGGPAYQHRVDCGHPWVSRVYDANGSAIPFLDRELCPEFYYEELRSGQFLVYRHSWDLQLHDFRNFTAKPAPAGDYLWELRVDTLPPREGRLMTQIPFTLGPQGEAS
jgi:hypothetical protein